MKDENVKINSILYIYISLSIYLSIYLFIFIKIGVPCFQTNPLVQLLPFARVTPPRLGPSKYSDCPCHCVPSSKDHTSQRRKKRSNPCEARQLGPRLGMFLCVLIDASSTVFCRILPSIPLSTTLLWIFCATPASTTFNHQPTFEVRGTAQVHIAGSEIFTSNIRDQLATAEVSRSLAGKKHSATHANVSCPVTSLKHTHTMKSKSRLATTDPANKRICPRNGEW